MGVAYYNRSARGPVAGRADRMIDQSTSLDMSRS
jgi:hypothetical protein